jgi:hypothetical protein
MTNKSPAAGLLFFSSPVHSLTLTETRKNVLSKIGSSSSKELFWTTRKKRLSSWPRDLESISLSRTGPMAFYSGLSYKATPSEKVSEASRFIAALILRGIAKNRTNLLTGPIHGRKEPKATVQYGRTKRKAVRTKKHDFPRKRSPGHPKN